MENSGKIFFEDDGAKWYVASGDTYLGPMSAADVYAEILAGKLTWAHFVWKQGQKNWVRICDSTDFQSAVPELPSKEIITQVKKEAAAPAKKSPPPMPKGDSAPAETKVWFLYYSDSQYGPFSTEEVERFLHIGRIHRRVHVWKDGMKGWDKIENVAAFSAAVVEAGLQAVKAQVGETTGKVQKEQRSSPRAPLVAKIMVAAGQSLSVAMCRDISVGGMQVLTDRLPGEVGSKVKLNVSAEKIEPFVAEGVIVRILEDKRGFSFRFDKLPDGAKRAIEKYIEAR